MPAESAPELLQTEAGKVMMTAVSFLGHFVLFSLFGSLSSSLWKTYPTLNSGQKVEWNSRIVSNIHALLSLVGGLLCFTDSGWSVHLDAAFGSYSNRSLWLCITLGYMSYDFCLCLVHYRVLGSPLMVLHHAVVITAFAVGLSFDIGTFYMYAFVVNEVTTPLVNQRWFYVLTGRRHTRAYAANVVVLGALFVLVRAVYNCYALYRMFHTWGVLTCWGDCPDIVLYAMSELRQNVAYFVSTLSCCHVLLNLVWTVMVLRVLVRTLSGKRAD